MKTVTTIREGNGLGVRRIVEDTGVHYVIAYDPTSSLATLPASVALEVSDAIADDLGEDLQAAAIAFPRLVTGSEDDPIPVALPGAGDQERLIRSHLARQTAIHIALLAHQLDKPGESAAEQVGHALDLVDEVEEQLQQREAIGEIASGKRIFSEKDLRSAMGKIWERHQLGTPAAFTAPPAREVADELIALLWGR
jgi:hypothetical protein